MDPIERVQYTISDNQELTEFCRLFTFKEGTNSCHVLILLNSFEQWQILNPSVKKSHNMQIGTSNTISVICSDFTASEVGEAKKNWSNINDPDDGSFFSGSLVPPFSTIGENKNMLMLESFGHTALVSLLQDAKCVPQEKSFFHSVIAKICQEPLLLKVFQI